MTRAEQMVKRLETHLKDKVMLEVPAAVGNFLWRPQGWPGRFIAWIWMRTGSCPD